MYTENTNLIEYIEQIEAENALLKGFMASVIIEAHRDHYGDAAVAYSDIKEIIQEAEKIMGDKAREYQPVKHGRWIETNDDTMKRCTECDVIHLIAQYPHGNANYCPNCGAKMDGGETE